IGARTAWSRAPQPADALRAKPPRSSHRQTRRNTSALARGTHTAVLYQYAKVLQLSRSDSLASTSAVGVSPATAQAARDSTHRIGPGRDPRAGTPTPARASRNSPTGRGEITAANAALVPMMTSLGSGFRVANAISVTAPNSTRNAMAR